MADPAALIVQRQAEFSRTFSRTRSTTFASTVANRFFSDNSLDRQRRVVECTKRRQARAREKALEQEQEVEQLQQAYEHKKRLRDLQNERETSRMTRRLHHVAAAFIQYEYRKYRHRRKRQRARERAAQFIIDFVYFHWRRRRRARCDALLYIQQRWRRYAAWKRQRANVRVLARFLQSLVQARRRREHRAAKIIQQWVQQWRWRRRVAACMRIQRNWRIRRWRQRMETHMQSRHLESQHAKQNACALLLQRAIGRFVVRQRILQRPEFRRFQELRCWTKTTTTTMDVRDHRHLTLEMWQTHRHTLANALATGKRLQSDETRLLNDIEALRERVKQCQDKRAEEQDRLRRFHAWAELRRNKDDELMRAQLHEWECRKRFEIRMELERELELERRQQLRPQQPPQSKSISVSRGSWATPSESDTRVEGV